MGSCAAGGPASRRRVPSDRQVADKRTGGHGTRNDLAVVRPPDGEPIVIAVMTTLGMDGAGPSGDLVAEATRIAVEALQAG